MEEFTKVIGDFIADLKTTFPEYEMLLNKGCADLPKLFEFCQVKFPPLFFDILNKNEDLFQGADTEFLPNIHFKSLWACDLSQNTRDIIWKYLQLVLFAVVGTLDNKELFGDAAKLFETINADEFKSKLEETFAGMQDMGPVPNADEMHGHISGMLDGKLGKLAKEIAEETAANLDLDLENVTDVKGVFNSLTKNPGKLMGLVKNVGEKLDTRIKSGELKESELISEATDIMNKMKNMPGMGDIQSLLAKMGLGGAGAGGEKVNMGAMNAQMERNLKAAKTKERILAKAERNRALRALEKPVQPQVPQNVTSDADLIAMFDDNKDKNRKKKKN
jgi:hypothetical protein